MDLSHLNQIQVARRIVPNFMQSGKNYKHLLPFPLFVAEQSILSMFDTRRVAVSKSPKTRIYRTTGLVSKQRYAKR